MICTKLPFVGSFSSHCRGRRPDADDVARGCLSFRSPSSVPNLWEGALPINRLRLSNFSIEMFARSFLESTAKGRPFLETASSCLPKKGCLSFRSPAQPAFKGETLPINRLCWGMPRFCLCKTSVYPILDVAICFRFGAVSLHDDEKAFLDIESVASLLLFPTISGGFIRRLFKLWTPRWTPLPINRLHRGSVPPHWKEVAESVHIEKEFCLGVCIVRCVIVRDWRAHWTDSIF